MITQNIHNVVSFKVTDIRDHTDNDDKFYTRKIIVTDKNGNEIELTMFSNDKDTLIPATSDQLGY